MLEGGGNGEEVADAGMHPCGAGEPEERATPETGLRPRDERGSADSAYSAGRRPCGEAALHGAIRAPVFRESRDLVGLRSAPTGIYEGEVVGSGDEYGGKAHCAGTGQPGSGEAIDEERGGQRE